MTPMEHYREAERLLRLSNEWRKVNIPCGEILQQAQAHATLATVSDAQYRPESRVK